MQVNRFNILQSRKVKYKTFIVNCYDKSQEEDERLLLLWFIDIVMKPY